MNRKWLYAFAAMVAVALVMFPLNLLLVGKPPVHAMVRSLLFGLPALLVAWAPKERRRGRRKGDGHKPAGKITQTSKVVWGAIAVAVLGAMFVHDACAEGVGVGIANAVGFALILLVGIVGYKLGYLKV